MYVPTQNVANKLLEQRTLFNKSIGMPQKVCGQIIQAVVGAIAFGFDLIKDVKHPLECMYLDI